MSDLPDPIFLSAGDTAFSVEFGRVVDPALNARVMGLMHALEQARREDRITGITDMVPSFRALLVHYSPMTTSREILEEEIRSLSRASGSHASAGRSWCLPACYDTDLALDLEDVAERTGKSPAEVIELHSGATYFVYMIGFMPGYPFMGGLNPLLELPRRTEPRLKIPARSVAIAMKLTGIYPFVSPGGWHILGRTPVEMFDQKRTDPILLAPGDTVRFEPVERSKYSEMETALAAGELAATTFLAGDAE